MTFLSSKHLLFVLCLFVFSCNEHTEDTSSLDTSTERNIENDRPDNYYIYSTIIAKKGEILSQTYYNGKSADSLCNIQSLTKSIMSVLIGIAIDKGHIKNENETIAAYFPEELKNVADDRKKSITIKHLLNQTSGLAWRGHLELGPWRASKNPIAFVLTKNMEAGPGAKYNYNSGATHLLSVIISKATGMPTKAFAAKHLFRPLGLGDMDWEIRNDGYHDGSGLGLSMRPIDVMTIAQTLENNGVWKDKRILSENWIEKMFNDKLKSKTNWGLRNSKHGYCWYKAEYNGLLIDYGMGYGGQFIVIVPKKELVIVATHEHDIMEGIAQQKYFLMEELPLILGQYAI